mmetsp:Transcript_21523/g.64392  ORF Transcript_21523/g.64392 Transcript_21523/m.64392 type:complete len:326 (-) Transcript_21523:804-1781(-)
MARDARKSLKRPGVATTQCTPRRRQASSWSRLGSPPIAHDDRSSRERSRSRKKAQTSCVCRASSREGHSTKPTGPSPGRRGRRFSRSSARMTSGTVKAMVLPEPVKAMPIMSRPESATGMPWTWMGVGRLMFFSRRALSRSPGRPMPSKVLIGGGTRSPSTRMHHFLRSASALASSKGSAAGRQSVLSALRKMVSVASSLADCSAFVCTRLASRIMRASSSCWRARASSSGASLASASRSSFASSSKVRGCSASGSASASSSSAAAAPLARLARAASRSASRRALRGTQSSSPSPASSPPPPPSPAKRPATPTTAIASTTMATDT